MAIRKVRKQTLSGNEANAAVRMVSDFIQDNSAILIRTLRVFVFNAGLGKGEAVRAIADELLQETTVEALKAADRFDTSRQPRAWLLGIAANIIKRKRARAIKLRKEVAVQDVRLGNETPLFSSHQTDNQLFDRFAAIAREKIPESASALLPSNDLARDYEANNAAEAMLARCSNEDQTILRLAILEELDGDAVARRLGVPPGTARVRLHRAIKRLRKSLEGEGLNQ